MRFPQFRIYKNILFKTLFCNCALIGRIIVDFKGTHTLSVVDTDRTAHFKTVQFPLHFKNAQLFPLTIQLNWSKKHSSCARVYWGSSLLRCDANCVNSLRKHHTHYKLELQSPNCAVKYQAEPDFIQSDKLHWKLLSFIRTRAVITEQICTAQAELCEKLSLCGRL
jgi:hypothetical protein